VSKHNISSNYGTAKLRDSRDNGIERNRLIKETLPLLVITNSYYFRKVSYDICVLVSSYSSAGKEIMPYLSRHCLGFIRGCFQVQSAVRISG
jgi:hypothetical protein